MDVHTHRFSLGFRSVSVLLAATPHSSEESQNKMTNDNLK